MSPFRSRISIGSIKTIHVHISFFFPSNPQCSLDGVGQRMAASVEHTRRGSEDRCDDRPHQSDAALNDASDRIRCRIVYGIANTNRCSHGWKTRCVVVPISFLLLLHESLDSAWTKHYSSFCESTHVLLGLLCGANKVLVMVGLLPNASNIISDKRNRYLRFHPTSYPKKKWPV